MNNIHSNSLLSLLTSKFSAKFRLLVMVLFVFLTPMFSFGQSPQAFDSNGTFIVPAGVTSITVQAWGAGGSGGGSSNAGFLSARGGGGGGGGAYATATFAVIPGGSLPVVVGTGGTGVSGDSGTSGSFSTITGYTGIIYAAGGSGGVANKSGGEPAGGSGGTVATSKGTPIAGGNGVDGDSGAFIRSGAGGAGANSGGAGGSSVTSGTSDGKLGLQPGGGGSGSRTSGSGGYQTGGNGGNGKVIISWVCPTYAFTAAASATAICGSGSSTVKLTSTSLPAGTYTVTYNTTNPGSSGNTATMVFSGTTGTFSTNILSATSTITVTNLSSGTAPSICSSVISSNNTASIVVNPVSVGGAVASAQTICSGTSPAALTLSGQTGTVVKWQRATDVGFTAGLADIVSTATTLPSATIGNLTTNTYFRAVLQSGICSVANSSPVLITVMPIVKITLGENPIIAQGTTSANLPYTLNNG